MLHSPYIFDKDGNIVYRYGEELFGEERADAMIEQLQFTNVLTEDFVNTILSKDPTNSIIIIQSDHGYRSGGAYDDSLEKEHLEQYYSNFAAYYFPDQDIEFLEPLTSVNTFRILFNTYFNGEYEILENQMFSVRGTEYVEHTETLLELLE